VHERFPKLWNGTLPPLPPGNCTGDQYLEQAGLLPVQYGGISGYFGILCGYVVATQIVAFAVLSWRVRLMHIE
jgi:hypothetical protein